MFIVALVLFIAGMWLTGFAFSLEAWQRLGGTRDPGPPGPAALTPRHLVAGPPEPG
jgi:hypothetical protein